VSYGVQGGGIQYEKEGAFREQLEQKKSEWAERISELYDESPIPFTGWEDWDGAGVLKQTHPLRWRP